MPQLPSKATPPAGSRPPRWLLPALILAAVVAMSAVLAWHAISSISAILLMLLCSLFLSLALEPPVDWLAGRSVLGHRVRRGAATGLVMVGLILVIAAIIGLFGRMFVTQLTELVGRAIDAWPQIVAWVQKELGFDIGDAQGSIDMGTVQQFVQKYGADLASGVLTVGASVAQVVISLLGVMLIVFYMVAQGPTLRATICRPLPPRRQEMVLQMWEISQEKISGYINSRVLLAALSTFFTFGFLQFVVKVPYALPLAVFVGVISQFVPTVGTYIAGAAPVLIALTISPVKALIVLAFIVAYQQVENLLFSPKISAKTMDINPAVAFVAVLVFGATMGPIGAFLSVPLAATIQAIASTYVHRYELVDSSLLPEPPTGGTSPGRGHGHGHAGGAQGGAQEGPSGHSAPDHSDSPPE